MMRFYTAEENELGNLTDPWIRARIVDDDAEFFIDPEAPEDVKKAYKRLQKIRQERPELVGFG